MRAWFTGYAVYLNSDYTVMFPDMDILQDNNGIFYAQKIGRNSMILYSQKTPQVSPGEGVTIGTLSLSIPNIAVPILLGSLTLFWKCEIIITNRTAVLWNRENKVLPNAYYKGSCVFVYET